MRTKCHGDLKSVTPRLMKAKDEKKRVGLVARRREKSVTLGEGKVNKAVVAPSP